MADYGKDVIAAKVHDDTLEEQGWVVRSLKKSWYAAKSVHETYVVILSQSVEVDHWGQTLVSLPMVREPADLAYQWVDILRDAVGCAQRRDQVTNAR